MVEYVILKFLRGISRFNSLYMYNEGVLSNKNLIKVSLYWKWKCSQIVEIRTHASCIPRFLGQRPRPLDHPDSLYLPLENIIFEPACAKI